jgi:hypothetical protein
MFLCEQCHDNVAKRCWICKVGGIFAMSHGRCENCGETHDCYDCHSY